MKKIIIIGVMVVIVVMVILGFKRADKKFEYFDFDGNYGISSDCKSTIDNLICKTDKGWIEVYQYSEIEK